MFDDFPTTYGSSSARPGALVMTRPCRCPNRGGPPDSCSPQKDHCDSSLSRLSWRQICRPQVCSSLVDGKRSCENGIRISTVQPRESMLVLTSHTGSHEGSPPPPRPLASCLTPDGLTRKKRRPM